MHHIFSLKCGRGERSVIFVLSQQLFICLKIEGIISGLNTTILDRKDRKSKEKVLAKYFVENINIHNVWAVKMFIVEIIYILNILGNICLMDIFLGRDNKCANIPF